MGNQGETPLGCIVLVLGFASSLPQCAGLVRQTVVPGDLPVENPYAGIEPVELVVFDAETK